MFTTTGFFVFFLLLVLSLTVFATGQIPFRPQNVPRDALWIGGPDGGVFITLQAKNPSRGIYLAKVFADMTGELLYGGKLTLVPPRPVLASTKNPTLFTAWDGSALLLTDGRRMVHRR